MFAFNSSHRRLLVALTVSATIFFASAQFSRAAPFTPGNVLIAAGNGFLYEYSDTGALLQTISVPLPNGQGPRDVVLDRNGNAQIWNGTFSPRLTTYDPNEETFFNSPLQGWSTINNVTYGAIDALENYVFVTDMRTAGGGAPNGVVRINIDDLSFDRISAGDVMDLDIGLDGLLYTLTRGNGFNGGGTRVTAYDPFSGEQIRSLNLPAEHRSIAIDAAGNIFANGVRKYDPSGNLIGSISLPFGADINISRDGRVMTADWPGGFAITDLDLTSGASFTTPSTNSSFGGGGFVEAPISDPDFVPPAVFLSFGSEWKYLDDGSNQAAAWRESEFDDSSWASGPAQLGYGDNDEATVVSFGGNASNKFATTYFRHTFTVDDASLVEEISGLLLRDDAGAVYLNGVEIFRDDTLPVDAAFDTLATAVGVENGTVSFSIEPALLVDGENVLAVEIHQATRGSSDISFDLRLTAVVNPIPEPGTLSLLAIGWGTLLCRRRRRGGIARGELALESNGTS